MDSLITPAKNLIKILRNVDNCVDLSKKQFLSPLELLPISSLISEKCLDYILPENEKCSGYLEYFNFPQGLSSFKTLFQSYIPIYKFSASKSGQISFTDKSETDKSEILDNLVNICVRKIGSPKGAVNALNLAIEEIIANIADHSDATYGWINAQYYPTQKYLDLCILDRGITIYGRYKQAKKEIKNDLEALKNALEGKSSKPEMIRGSGLPTFIRLITGAFKGEIIIISGNAIAHASKSRMPRVQQLTVRWDGTVVALRIPRNEQPIDYTKFID